jgi:hypothetical protein
MKQPKTDSLPLDVMAGDNKADDAQLATAQPNAPAVRHTAMDLLEAAVNGGITKDSVEVVKELRAMVREERNDQAKAEFAKAFFRAKRDMPEIYADKEAKDRNGNVVYVYCSEEEISKKLDPHLMRYGLTTMFGQTEKDGRITVEVTLIHEGGHSEIRGFTVRAGTPNAMKDGAMCDAGAATTALRHLLTKWFGLKSRITDFDAKTDASIVGETIKPDKQIYLKERVKEVGADERAFLEYATGSEKGTYADIAEGRYDELVAKLNKKART